MAKAKSKKKPKQNSKQNLKLTKKIKFKAPAKKVASKKVKSKKSVIKKATKSPSKPVKKIAVMVKIQKKQDSIKKPQKLDLSEFVTPLDDRMIVQVSEKEKRTPGGLIIPDTVSNVAGHREGVVLSVGRGHRDPKGRVRPMDVKTGDKILFSDFTGSKLNYQGHDLIILRETDVMGVID